MKTDTFAHECWCGCVAEIRTTWVTKSKWHRLIKYIRRCKQHKPRTKVRNKD